MIYGLPNDWCYQVKKAMNYRIYSNPICLLDLVDIVHRQLEQTVGVNNVTYFKLDDFNKQINFRFTYPDLNMAFSIIDQIHAASVVEFCTMYKDNIIFAINEQAGKIYSDAFVDMLENDHPILISQLSILFGHPVMAEGQFSVTFRLY